MRRRQTYARYLGSFPTALVAHAFDVRFVGYRTDRTAKEVLSYRRDLRAARRDDEPYRPLFPAFASLVGSADRRLHLRAARVKPARLPTRLRHAASDHPRIRGTGCRPTRRLEAQAARLPPGRRKNELLRKIRQLETASHISDWLSSPGLQPPKD
jgi:hypothetical protein